MISAALELVNKQALQISPVAQLHGMIQAMTAWLRDNRYSFSYKKGFSVTTEGG